MENNQDFKATGDRITINYGRTIELSKYNSLRLSVEIDSTAEPGESIEDALTRLWALARKSVYNQYQELQNGGADYGSDDG